MALTTAANRNSAAHFRKLLAPIFPDGTIAQLDRQSSVNSYGGILAAIPGIGRGISGDQTIWFLFDDDDPSVP